MPALRNMIETNWILSQPKSSRHYCYTFVHPHSVVHLRGALALERQRPVLGVVRKAPHVLSALRDVVRLALVLVDVHGEVAPALLDPILAGAVHGALL